MMILIFFRLPFSDAASAAIFHTLTPRCRFRRRLRRRHARQRDDHFRLLRRHYAAGVACGIASPYAFSPRGYFRATPFLSPLFFDIYDDAALRDTDAARFDAARFFFFATLRCFRIVCRDFRPPLL